MKLEQSCKTIFADDLLEHDFACHHLIHSLEVADIVHIEAPIFRDMSMSDGGIRDQKCPLLLNRIQAILINCVGNVDQTRVIAVYQIFRIRVYGLLLGLEQIALPKLIFTFFRCFCFIFRSIKWPMTELPLRDQLIRNGRFFNGLNLANLNGLSNSSGNLIRTFIEVVSILQSIFQRIRETENGQQKQKQTEERIHSPNPHFTSLEWDSEEWKRFNIRIILDNFFKVGIRLFTIHVHIQNVVHGLSHFMLFLTGRVLSHIYFALPTELLLNLFFKFIYFNLQILNIFLLPIPRKLCRHSILLLLNFPLLLFGQISFRF